MAMEKWCDHWKFLSNLSDFTGCFDMKKYDGKELEASDIKDI